MEVQSGLLGSMPGSLPGVGTAHHGCSLGCGRGAVPCEGVSLPGHRVPTASPGISRSGTERSGCAGRLLGASCVGLISAAAPSSPSAGGS